MKEAPAIDSLHKPSAQQDAIAAFLAHKMRAGADSGELAETIATTCREIDGALSPIIGRKGVAALCERSIYLASRTHPWLAGAHDGASTFPDVGLLSTVLALRTSADAAAAGTLLLQTFCGLMTTLVGASLTERLLRPVWLTFLSGQTASGTSS